MTIDYDHQIHLVDYDGEQIGDATSIDIVEQPARVITATMTTGVTVHGQVLEVHETVEDGSAHTWFVVYPGATRAPGNQ